MPKPVARYSHIDVRLCAPNLGAEIGGVVLEDGVTAIVAASTESFGTIGRMNERVAG